jgi:hypothetical protein
LVVLTNSKYDDCKSALPSGVSSRSYLIRKLIGSCSKVIESDPDLKSKLLVNKKGSKKE